MKRPIVTCIVGTLISLGLTACNSSSKSVTGTTVTSAKKSTTAVVIPPLSSASLALGITAVPPELAKVYTPQYKFNRYAKHLAPNGEAIHIVAQDKLSDDQIVRARSILGHYLKDYSGSIYGADKSAIANKMTENGAILLLLNGSDDGTNPAGEVDGQPLYQEEIQVEGGKWYFQQDYNHRDASFEEILHLVHDYGIGVDQGETFEGALPAYQADIRAAQISAQSNKVWGGESEWISELTIENSLTQEYLASVIDAYYGLWGAWQSTVGDTSAGQLILDEKTLSLDWVTTRSMWGGYAPKNRAEISTEDQAGTELMTNKFFHPYLTYNARIAAEFAGEFFSLRLNSDFSYTNHSQYLKDITLTGTKNTAVVVNQLDNNITGNSGNNRVILSGVSSEYTVEKQADGSIVVTDLVDDRDGINRLSNIEILKFKSSYLSLVSID
ncbi:MAG: hypothetical protein HRU23_14575 [Gammaproteobacteria bacterium]|nr:hypothetical protein [Gammaproteobacteria bacterium]